MLVSVIVPTRNRLGFLKEAIASVYGQSMPTWELIVVDDASTDSTWQWLEREKQQNERLKIVRLEEHSERSAARNRGTWLAKGDLALFLDDDDRLRPTALETLTRALVRHPSAVAVVGAAATFGLAHRPWRLPHPRTEFARWIWTDVFMSWIPSQGQYLCRTDLLVRAGGWNEHLVASEDEAFWLRMARLGPVVLTPKVVLDYREHAGQWRPPDLREVEDELREQLAHVLQGRDRRIALCILRARRLEHRAVDAYLARRYVDSVGAYLRLFAIAPAVLMSPLLRTEILSAFLRSVFGMALGYPCLAAVKRLRARGRVVGGPAVRGSARRGGGAAAPRTSCKDART